MTKINRTSKNLRKAKHENGKINAEAKAIKVKLRDKTSARSPGNIFSGMSKDEAVASVGKEINAVEVDDIYPKDLEREFDILEDPKMNKSESDDAVTHMDRDPTQEDDDEVIDLGDE